MIAGELFADASLCTLGYVMDDFLRMIIFDPAYIYSHKNKDPNNF
jgi:hypothetical protein